MDYHEVCVHEITLGDVEHPDLYIAEPLINWEKSQMGKWVMSNAIEPPIWHRHQDYNSFGWRYTITAKFRPRDYTYWMLKWSKT